MVLTRSSIDVAIWTGVVLADGRPTGRASRLRHETPIPNQLAIRNPQSAIVLFDGRSLDSLARIQERRRSSGLADRRAARWPRTGRVGDIMTKEDVRQFRARAIEWKIGAAGNSRHLLPRHRGIRSHLLERARVSTARRRQGRRQQDAADLRRRRLRAVSVASRPPETGRRVEYDADRRQRQSRRALAQRLQAARVRVRQRGLGSQGQGRASSRTIRTTATRRAATSRCRAIMTASLAFRNIQNSRAECSHHGQT